MDYRPHDRIGQKKLAIAALPQPEFPTGRYRLIVADPPWSFSLRESDSSHRGRCGYPQMEKQEIEALPVEPLACRDAYLLLWFTVQHTEQAFELARRWGFEPKTFHTWVKTCKTKPDQLKLGNGHYGRGGTEHFIVATRGNPKSWLTLGLTDIPNGLVVPWTGTHSEKPPEFWAIANRLKGALEAYHGNCPAIELFARQERDGWDAWGNEIQEEVA